MRYARIQLISYLIFPHLFLSKTDHLTVLLPAHLFLSPLIKLQYILLHTGHSPTPIGHIMLFSRCSILAMAAWILNPKIWIVNLERVSQQESEKQGFNSGIMTLWHWVWSEVFLEYTCSSLPPCLIKLLNVSLLNDDKCVFNLTWVSAFGSSFLPSAKYLNSHSPSPAFSLPFPNWPRSLLHC